MITASWQPAHVCPEWYFERLKCGYGPESLNTSNQFSNLTLSSGSSLSSKRTKCVRSIIDLNQQAQTTQYPPDQGNYFLVSTSPPLSTSSALEQPRDPTSCFSSPQYPALCVADAEEQFSGTFQIPPLYSGKHTVHVCYRGNR